MLLLTLVVKKWQSTNCEISISGSKKQDVVIDMLVHLCGRRDLAEWIWFICNE